MEINQTINVFQYMQPYPQWMKIVDFDPYLIYGGRQWKSILHKSTLKPLPSKPTPVIY